MSDLRLICAVSVNSFPVYLFLEMRWEIVSMLKTIMLGTCVSVQGILEKKLPDGRVTVRVGNRLFTGNPVTA